MKDYVHHRYDDLPVELKNAVLEEWHVQHRPAFYDLDRSRERMSPALRNTRTYHLRKPNLPLGTVVRTESAKDVIDCVDTPLARKFPALWSLIEWTGAQRGGFTTIGRVFVTRLEQSSSIGRHIDEGHYFETLHRHHFVLRSQATDFCWDNDRATMMPGELWRVNNSVPHWVENDNAPRTVVIFDAA